MKTRSSFVSNSSSSSFIVCLKDMSPDEFAEKYFSEGFAPDHPLADVFDSILSSVKRELNRLEVLSLEEFLSDWRMDNLEEAFDGNGEPPAAAIGFKRGMKVYQGSFATDDGGISEAIADSYISVVTEDYIIHNER